VPADGVYAGRLVRGVSGASVELPAAISIGTNPTFAGRERRVEAFVLDFAGDLYGEAVGVSFAERLRGTETFDGVEALVAQMDRDVEQTRALLGA
jgi:riboflavin kinase/FMN adenylyltransferase